MTNEEAVRVLKADIESCIDTGGLEEKREADEMAVEALQYRTKIRPEYNKIMGYFKCPACNIPLNPDGINNYCDNCGQSLDWTEDRPSSSSHVPRIIYAIHPSSRFVCRCPRCQKVLGQFTDCDDDTPAYCPSCGLRLDWPGATWDDWS